MSSVDSASRSYAQTLQHLIDIGKSENSVAGSGAVGMGDPAQLTEHVMAPKFRMRSMGSQRPSYVWPISVRTLATH